MISVRTIAIAALGLLASLAVLAQTEQAPEIASESETASPLENLTAEAMLEAVKAPVRELYRGKVIAVSAGDMLIVEAAEGAANVRVYGVDCPDPKQPYAEEAKAFAVEHFLNADVDVSVVAEDGDGTPVALVVNAAGDSLGHMLAYEGLAWWDQRNASKDVLLRKLNVEAIEKGKGLYADAAALAPWDYRDSEGADQFAYALDPVKEAPKQEAAAPEKEAPRTISARGTMTEGRPRTMAPPSANSAAPPKLDDLGKDVDLPGLMMRHQPRIAYDDAGKPLGLTASDVAGIPYAAQLGFREGDIVSRVNGIAVESEAQIIGMIPQFENVKQFQVEVLRNGQRVTIPINVP